ncbi:MAG: hypothetical protein ACOVRP_04610, partial [Gemmatimonas sp.]
MIANAWRACLAGAPRPVHLDVAGLMGEHLEAGTFDDHLIPADLLQRIGRTALAPSAQQLDAAAQAIRRAGKVAVLVGTDAVASGAAGALTAL